MNIICNVLSTVMGPKLAPYLFGITDDILAMAFSSAPCKALFLWSHISFLAPIREVRARALTSLLASYRRQFHPLPSGKGDRE